MLLYVNGSVAAGTNLTYSAILDGGNPHVIGRDENSGVRYLPGTLDEVGDWSEALTPEDITALMVDGECGLSSI